MPCLPCCCPRAPVDPHLPPRTFDLPALDSPPPLTGRAPGRRHSFAPCGTKRVARPEPWLRRPPITHPRPRTSPQLAACRACGHLVKHRSSSVRVHRHTRDREQQPLSSTRIPDPSPADTVALPGAHPLWRFFFFNTRRRRVRAGDSMARDAPTGVRRTHSRRCMMARHTARIPQKR